MINDKQMRAGRALLGWSREELAERAGLSAPTIKRMEVVGPKRSSLENVMAVKKALESAGVVFIDENGQGAGVRMAKPGPDDGDLPSHV
jgi:predicted transcriptional regulator